MLQNSTEIINFAFVKEIERHIESLLLYNDCVIVPNLGGFVAHHVGAHYSEGECLFLPPTRQLGFNPQLTMNDSLMVQSYVDAYDISYPEALARVEHEVTLLHKALEEKGHCEFDGLGTLYKNNEGKLSFAPCEAGILTPSLYALDSFEAKPLRTLSEPQSTASSTSQAVIVTRDEKSGQRRLSVSLRSLRHAAVAVCVLAICVFVISPMSIQKSDMGKVQSGMFSCLYESNSGEAAPKTMKLSVDKKKEYKVKEDKKQVWTIVLCTHVPLSGAEVFCKALKNQGFNDARILDHDGSIKVVYGSYASEAQARTALQGIQPNRYFNTAWLLNVAK